MQVSIIIKATPLRLLDPICLVDQVSALVLIIDVVIFSQILRLCTSH